MAIETAEQQSSSSRIPQTSSQTFIETQFPVSKISKESYKERKANYSQTLTGLGKWWGRKPLVLVRASLIGLLMPGSNAPKKDRDIFLKILTMDQEGLLRRKTKSITQKQIFARCTPREREKWFAPESTAEKAQFRKTLKREDRERIQIAIFLRLSYDEKLEYCDRPEQIDGPSEEAWKEINAHLGTTAASLVELVQQLGRRQFGYVPRVGDAFCGGGSIPFEAARLGCEAFGSDLNPVATLLTWAALNVVGGGPDVAKQVREALRKVYDAVNCQITEWAIEHNEDGWRADAYLYCTETRCPECGWMVPLAPSWVIGEKTCCVARLVLDKANRRFEIKIESDVSDKAMVQAKAAGTVRDSSLICPNPECGRSTPIMMIRGDRRGENGTQYGLRLWENDDVVPRPDDVFQERLYCIRWVEKVPQADGTVETNRYYMAPDHYDMAREQKVLELEQERFHEWQAKGYIPSRRIEPGDETTRLIRERGWTHWHHLFTPRQLLTLGTFAEFINIKTQERSSWIEGLLEIGRLIDTKGIGCRLLRWNSHSSKEMHATVFSNQALNTLFNYCCRTLYVTELIEEKSEKVIGCSEILPADARAIEKDCDIWSTDPPYADAISYPELSEFFLAWDERHLSNLFPHWHTDSKRALAISGSDQGFRKGMVDCYRKLATHMPDNGLQIVMFTHQDASVWADLALILWAAGLRVTAAWCVATETDSPLKEGNYVQGTVLLVLRKQTSQDVAFLDELVPKVEREVKAQLDAMLALDDKESPNFSDTDYQLAAYAAALRVLTQYRQIEDFDVAYELTRIRAQGEQLPIEKVITQAVRVACDHMIPHGLDKSLWKMLTPEERFYVKGLDIESHHEYRSGAYQELARGFGIREYKPLLASDRANQVRLKTASEFGTRNLGNDGFSSSLVRHALFAVFGVVRSGEVTEGKNWLRAEVKDYWGDRKNLIGILSYLSNMNAKIPHWKEESEAARLLAGALENDHV